MEEGKFWRVHALIANEILEEISKKDKNCVLFKLDFEKAYDSFDWGHLYMMKLLGFNEKWCSWIKEFISTGESSYGELMLQNGMAKVNHSLPFFS